MPEKIIIDTDPGIDDAMAIFFAMASPKLELLGLTTTFGNVSVDMATENALRLVEMSGQSIPVARGASHPWVQPLQDFPDFVHGHDGFGNLNLPAPKGKAIDLTAAQFIVSTVLNNPHEITLIAIGPLVNLALALKLEPRIATLVKKVIIMGGTIDEPGNVSPVAEANIYCDPHAADKVFSADWHVHMVGLDVTHKVLMLDALQARIRDTNPMCGQFLYDAGRFYADFYSKNRGAEGCYVHDASAIAYAIEPDLFDVIEGPLRVATEGIAKGQTIIHRNDYIYPETHWDSITPSSVCMGVDGETVIALYEETMAQ